jgi:hypothetical protein
MDFGRDKNEEKEAGQDTGRKHGAGQRSGLTEAFGLELDLLGGHGSNPHLVQLLHVL